MGYLLTRRREMILQSAVPPEGPLLYSLENRTVVDSEVIDTGVAPLRAGKNMTILFDMTITTNPTNTAQAYRYTLMRIGGWDWLTVLKPSQWNAGIRARPYNASDNDTTAKILPSAAGRKRIVITHVANTNQMMCIGKNNNDAATVKTIIGNVAFSPTDATLHFGLTGTGYGLPPGTIHLAQVYNTILSQEEIDAFLA